MRERDDEDVWAEAERQFALEGHDGQSVLPTFVKRLPGSPPPPVPLPVAERHRRYDEAEHLLAQAEAMAKR